MANVVRLREPEPTGALAGPAAPFIVALKELHGTTIRLHRIAGTLEGVNGTTGAIAHLVKSADEISYAAECLLAAVCAAAQQAGHCRR